MAVQTQGMSPSGQWVVASARFPNIHVPPSPKALTAAEPQLLPPAQLIAAWCSSRTTSLSLTLCTGRSASGTVLPFLLRSVGTTASIAQNSQVSWFCILSPITLSCYTQIFTDVLASLAAPRAPGKQGTLPSCDLNPICCGLNVGNSIPKSASGEWTRGLAC